MDESEGSVRKNTNEWNKARIAARQRDGDKCVLCSSCDDIEVHHIDYDPDNHVLWNMITLCKPCHVLVHKPKSDSEVNQLLKYIQHLQTTHFHPEARFEMVLRYLGGFDFLKVPSSEEELNSILEDSYGYYEFEHPDIELQLGTLGGFGEPRIIFARFCESGDCPVPIAELQIQRDFKKISSCKHEWRSPMCDCIGFYGDQCPEYGCKKEWCKEATLDTGDSPFEGEIEGLPYIILKARCDPGSPAGYEDQSRLSEFD